MPEYRWWKCLSLASWQEEMGPFQSFDEVVEAIKWVVSLATDIHNVSERTPSLAARLDRAISDGGEIDGQRIWHHGRLENVCLKLQSATSEKDCWQFAFCLGADLLVTGRGTVANRLVNCKIQARTGSRKVYSVGQPVQLLGNSLPPNEVPCIYLTSATLKADPQEMAELGSLAAAARRLEEARSHTPLPGGLPSLGKRHS